MKKSLLKLVRKGSKRGLAFFLVLTMIFSANVFSAIKTVYANEPVDVVEEAKTENEEVAESVSEVSEELSENETEEEILEEKANSSEEAESNDEEPEVAESKDEELEEPEVAESNDEELEEAEPEGEEPEETELKNEEPEEDELNEEESKENEINVEETDEINEEVKTEETEAKDEETEEEKTEETEEEKTEETEEVKTEETEEVKTEETEEVKTEETEEVKTEEIKEESKEITESAESKELVDEAKADDKEEVLLNELSVAKDVVKEEVKTNEVKNEKVLFGAIEHKTYTVTRNWAGDYDIVGTNLNVDVDIYSNDTWGGMTLSGWLAENVDLKLGKPKQNGYKFVKWNVHFDPTGLVWSESVDPSTIEYDIDTDNEGNYNDLVGVPISETISYVSGDLVITAEPVWIISKTYDVTLDWSGSYDVSPAKTDVQVDIYSGDYCELMDATLSGWLVESLDLQLGKPSNPGFEFKKWDIHFDPSSLVWNDSTGSGDVVDPADLDYHKDTDNEGNCDDMVGAPIDAKFEYVSGDLVITAKPLWSKTYDVTLNWAGDYDISPAKTDIQVDIYSGDYCELMDATLSGWLAENVDLQLGKPKQDGYIFEKWDIHFDPSSLVWNDTMGSDVVDPADLEADEDTDSDGNYNGMEGKPIDAKFEYVSGDLEITAEPQWTKNVIELVLDDNGGSGGAGTIYECYAQGIYSDSECTTSITSVAVPTKVDDEFKGYFWNDVKYIDESGNFTGDFTFDAFDHNETLKAQWNSTEPRTWTEVKHATRDWSGEYEPGKEGNDGDINFTFRSGYPDPINGWETDHYFFEFGKAKQDGYWFNGWDIIWKDNTIWNPSVEPAEFHDFANDEGKNDGNRNRMTNSNSVYQSGSVEVTAIPNWRKKIWGITLDDNGGAGGSGKIFEWHTKGIYADEQCDASQITSVVAPTKEGSKFLGYFKDDIEYIDQNGNLTANFTADAFNADTPLKAEWVNIGSTIHKITLDSTGCTSKVTVLYKQVGGDIYSDEGCTKVVTVITKPTKSGYTFNGYWTQQNKKGTQCIDSKGNIKKAAFEDKDMTIYPAWTKNGGSKSSGGGGGGGSDTYVGGPKVENGLNPIQTGINSQVNAVPSQANAKSVPVKTSDIPVLAENTQWKFNIDNTWSLALDKNNQDVKAVNGFYALVSNDANGQPQARTYYFDEAGKMVTGWVRDAQGSMYFFETDKQANEGEMVVGWKALGNEWYFFGGDGKMFVNTVTPDGSIVGADGKWQR